MTTITVKLTDFQLGELAHKLSIVTEEPELQESYEVTQEEVDALYASLPRGKAKHYAVEFDSKFLDLVIGELENDYDIFADNGREGIMEYLRGASSLRGAINKIKAAAAAAGVKVEA